MHFMFGLCSPPFFISRNSEFLIKIRAPLGTGSVFIPLVTTANNWREDSYLCQSILCEAGVSLLSLVYRLWISDLPKVICVVLGQGRVWIQAGWFQSHHFEPLCYNSRNYSVGLRYHQWGLFLNLRWTCMILASSESGLQLATLNGWFGNNSYHWGSTYLFYGRHFAYIISKLRFFNLSSMDILDQIVLFCGDAICAL